ncbi:unnamed protein product, partial [Allacma fusca]
GQIIWNSELSTNALCLIGETENTEVRKPPY